MTFVELQITPLMNFLISVIDDRGFDVLITRWNMLRDFKVSKYTVEINKIDFFLNIRYLKICRLQFPGLTFFRNYLWNPEMISTTLSQGLQ